MSKSITFFLVMLLGTSILGGIMKGGGGVEATPLTGDITATDTTLPFDTTDYLGTDYVIVEGEKIHYTGTTGTTATGCTRGYDDTTPAAHQAGALVYTADASAMNNALGFNLGAQQDSIGWVAVLAIPFNFFVITIPRIIRMNLDFLTGPLAIIGWLWLAMAAGFVITLALMIVSGLRVR